MRPGEAEERRCGEVAVLPGTALLRRPAEQKEALALKRHVAAWQRLGRRLPVERQRRQWGAVEARLSRLPQLVSARGWP